MTASTRVVWVESVRKLYTYEPVTMGDPMDIGMAYDVTMMPMERCLTSSDNIKGEIEIVADLVALDDIRAELGLYRSTLLKKAVNRLWRSLGLDYAALDRSPGKWREYRVGHPCQSDSF